jgi:hypothetical protein
LRATTIRCRKPTRRHMTSGHGPPARPPWAPRDSRTHHRQRRTYHRQRRTPHPRNGTLPLDVRPSGSASSARPSSPERSIDPSRAGRNKVPEANLSHASPVFVRVGVDCGIGRGNGLLRLRIGERVWDNLPLPLLSSKSFKQNFTPSEVPEHPASRLTSSTIYGIRLSNDFGGYTTTDTE